MWDLAQEDSLTISHSDPQYHGPVLTFVTKATPIVINTLAVRAREPSVGVLLAGLRCNGPQSSTGAYLGQPTILPHERTDVEGACAHKKIKPLEWQRPSNAGRKHVLG